MFEDLNCALIMALTQCRRCHQVIHLSAICLSTPRATSHHHTPSVTPVGTGLPLCTACAPPPSPPLRLAHPLPRPPRLRCLLTSPPICPYSICVRGPRSVHWPQRHPICHCPCVAPSPAWWRARNRQATSVPLMSSLRPCSVNRP